MTEKLSAGRSLEMFSSFFPFMYSFISNYVYEFVIFEQPYVLKM